MKTIVSGRIAAFLVLSIMMSQGGDAIADGMTTYNYTNLGQNTSYSTDGNGDRVIVTSTGEKYAFPTSSQYVSYDAFAKMGAPLPPYDSNPKDQYFQVVNPRSGLSNQNGYFVTTAFLSDRYDDHFGSSDVFSFKREQNGTFSPAKVLFSNTGDALDIGNSEVHVLGLSKNNLVLATVPTGIPNDPKSYLYDLNTGTITMLPWGGIDGPMTNPSAFVGVDVLNPYALDDQGRMLLNAEALVGGNYVTETVLATPAGLSTNPLPTPEPTTLVTLGLVAIGVLIGRQRRV